MASMNKVFILGRLGKDPELRYTQNQTPVTSLSIATTDYRNSAQGEKQEFTEWHRVTVFGRQADNVSKYLAKGSLAFFEGRLRTSSWEDQNGQKRYQTEIVASSVQFLSSGKQNGASYRQNNNSTDKDNGAGFPISKMEPPQGPYGNIKPQDMAKDNHDAQLPIIDHDDSAGDGNNTNPLPF